MFILLHESIINRIIKEQTDHYQSALYYTPDVAKGCSVIENFSCNCLFDDHDFCVVHISVVYLIFQYNYLLKQYIESR